jgi:AcrR family transcriptional regulator
MPRPKEIDRKDIKKLVLKKSQELFIKYGYDNVTMRRIAKEIGYSPAAIYLYYQSKDEIFYEIYNEGFSLLYKEQMEALNLNADPMEKLREHARRYTSFAMKHPEYYTLMFILKEPQKYMEKCREDKLNPQLMNYAEKSFDVLLENVKQCQHTGHFKGHDQMTVAFTIWSIVHGMASLIIQERVPAPPEFLESLLATALAFLKTVMEKE